MKTCNCCNELKPYTDFYKQSRKKDGHHGSCKLCMSIKEQSYYYKDGVKTTTRRLSQKNTQLKRLYGVTLEQVESIHTDQNNCCAICAKPVVVSGNSLTRADIGCVDHNHITGKVRGILCHSCNRALGLFKDSISILNSAQQYLEKYND